MRFPQILIVAAIAATTATAQDRPWSVAPEPSLILGDASNDKAVRFGAGLIGAVKLPDGRILVGDRGDFSLKVFDASGKLVKSLGRKGSGPGEISYLAELWRCGNEVVTYDIQRLPDHGVFD